MSCTNREDALVAIHGEISVRFYINVMLVPALVIIGMTGNSLAVCVMQSVSFGFPSTKFFISWLAVFDMIYLIGSLLFQTTRTIQFDTEWMADYHIYPYLHPYIWPYMSTVQTVETWLVVTIAIDRYVALCHPLKASQFCTKRRAAFTLILILVGSIILNIPHAFEFQPGHRYDPCTNMTKVVIESSFLFKNRIYQIVYWCIMAMLLRFLVPFGMLCWVTVQLIWALRSLKKARRERTLELMLTRPNGVQSRITNKYTKEDSVTPTLLAVVLMFALCESIEFVMHILTAVRWNNKYYEIVEDREAQQIANTIGNLLLVFNATINFLLYIVFAPQFRSALMAILGCSARRSCDGASLSDINSKSSTNAKLSMLPIRTR